MKVKPYTNDLKAFLVADEIIDYNNESIIELSNKLAEKSENEIEYIKSAYDYVGNNIYHSADINNDIITCTASEVLKAGHGICFAKSHLLAGLLRCKSIPAGFCYQKILLDDETAPILIYHGLNGIYLKDYNKWIRLDARGNRDDINAQFSIDEERLAFKVRPELGEKDYFTVYPNPDLNVIEKLKSFKTRTELWDNLPQSLAYEE